MTHWTVDSAATALLDAEEARADREPLTDDWPGLDLATGYAVQDETLRRRLGRGERLAGLKLGLTSLFGHWFWEYYQAGTVVYLDDMIAETQDTVFWVDTTAILGTRCFAVSADVKDPAGCTLPQGRYMTYLTLRAGGPVPSLSDLLADPSRTDIAPRFRD